MSKIYTRKGYYRDGLSNFLNFLGFFMLLAGGPGLAGVFLMGHIGEAPRGLIHLPVYIAFLVPILGVYFVKTAKRRAYGDDPLFRIRPIGIMLLILQVLTVVELLLDKAFDIKSILFSLVPAIFAFPILFQGCKRKSRTVSILLVVFAATILLANIDKLIHEIPGKGLLMILVAVLVLLAALILHKRRKNHMTSQEEAEFI